MEGRENDACLHRKEHCSINLQQEQFVSLLEILNPTWSESMNARRVWVRTHLQRLQSFISGEKHLIEFLLNAKGDEQLIHPAQRSPAITKMWKLQLPTCILCRHLLK